LEFMIQRGISERGRTAQREGGVPNCGGAVRIYQIRAALGQAGGSGPKYLAPMVSPFVQCFGFMGFIYGSWWGGLLAKLKKQRSPNALT